MPAGRCLRPGLGTNAVPIVDAGDLGRPFRFSRVVDVIDTVLAEANLCSSTDMDPTRARVPADVSTASILTVAGCARVTPRPSTTPAQQ